MRLMPLPPPVDQSADALADWLEAYLLGSGQQGLGAETARALLARQVGAPDASAGMALNTMSRRRLLLGDKYPFEVTGVGIKRPLAARTYYEALFLMSSVAAPYRASDAKLRGRRGGVRKYRLRFGAGTPWPRLRGSAVCLAVAGGKTPGLSRRDRMACRPNGYPAWAGLSPAATQRRRR